MLKERRAAETCKETELEGRTAEKKDHLAETCKSVEKEGRTAETWKRKEQVESDISVDAVVVVVADRDVLDRFCCNQHRECIWKEGSSRGHSRRKLTCRCISICQNSSGMYPFLGPLCFFCSRHRHHIHNSFQTNKKLWKKV